MLLVIAKYFSKLTALCVSSLLSKQHSKVVVKVFNLQFQTIATIYYIKVPKSYIVESSLMVDEYILLQLTKSNWIQTAFFIVDSELFHKRTDYNISVRITGAQQNMQAYNKMVDYRHCK